MLVDIFISSVVIIFISISSSLSEFSCCCRSTPTVMALIEPFYGAINSGAAANGEVVRETTEEQRDFDFDALAELVEMKVHNCQGSFSFTISPQYQDACS